MAQVEQVVHTEITVTLVQFHQTQLQQVAVVQVLLQVTFLLEADTEQQVLVLQEAQVAVVPIVLTRVKTQPHMQVKAVTLQEQVTQVVQEIQVVVTHLITVLMVKMETAELFG